ncbi:hypothetical protein [Pseudomonas aeruginosa]|uniref:hypothetical protein n=1 Tax=Pseudomonas aeruginosa TaxID=287 RepID=UPI001C376A78|nr:hypothetical protein [Pseudomonas aeruginosa]
MSKELNKAPAEQAGGDERVKCAVCVDSGKVYDISGEGPWKCYACTGSHEVIGYANGDELDNMLDDRTAVLSPVKTSFHTVPVYREARAALARVAELELKLDQSDYAYDNDRHHMRGMAKQAAEAIQVFTGHDSGANLAHRYGEKWWEHLDELRDALLAFAKNAPPAQAQHSVPETINEEANSFLRIADAGQFKDNAVAVRTAAVIIRGLLHRPAIMKSIIRHRIGLTPEYEGQWHADLYGEDGEVQHHAEADTPDEAVRAVVALAAAPGKEEV